ncbi:glycoside hydrolase family 6 protein [Pendulispora rubella]|uniref:glycoside hydrolase family 6 protein n=1 Tax=Pendulispora rubella TaxID=2741070 RepID=UPI00374E1272
MRLHIWPLVIVQFTMQTVACSSTDSPGTGRPDDHGNDGITGDSPKNPPGDGTGDPGTTADGGTTTDAGTVTANGFYVDPDSNSANWAKNHGGDSRAAAIKSNIANKPGARWFGNWNNDIAKDVSSFVGAAAAAKKWPILVAYNIPGRDCGGASSGGAGSAEAFRTWIASFARAVGNREAIVVVEPDALAQLDCLPNDGERQTRLDLMKYATDQFRTLAPKARAYVDGGNAKWITPATMAKRLDSAGVRSVRGFAINVSNFYTTGESTTYGNDVSAALSSQFGYTTKFVIDTSRNGNGSLNGEWCNPAGRKLGEASKFGSGNTDALLWVKVPGDSDGPCGSAPDTPAGTFSPDIATRLINGT